MNKEDKTDALKGNRLNVCIARHRRAKVSNAPTKARSERQPRRLRPRLRMTRARRPHAPLARRGQQAQLVGPGAPDELSDALLVAKRPRGHEHHGLRERDLRATFSSVSAATRRMPSTFGANAGDPGLIPHFARVARPPDA